VITLVLGGARSGKSRYAEDLFKADAAPVYIATGQSFDEEMRERVERHKARRGPQWRTIEEPFDLVGALQRQDAPVLVDCLTLWLTNLLLAERDIEAEAERLIACLPKLKQRVVLVGNEVGLGIVPDNKLSRLFRDHAGRLHQDIAAVADRVVFVAAGLPLTLKGG